MKIICNKNEFAQLVRKCQYTSTEGDCDYCVFAGMCSSGEFGDDFSIMSGIEDICEVVIDG